MASDKLGLVQVYWGNGKGKTTASLGLSSRALGRGLRVHFVQFMKGGLNYTDDFNDLGELIALSKFENFSAKRFGFREWVIGKPKKDHYDAAWEGFTHAKESSSSGKFDLVVLDEILYAVQMGLLDEGHVLELIDSKADNTELVLTGSHKPLARVFERADLVTEVKKHKHPFDKGVPARFGVEF